MRRASTAIDEQQGCKQIRDNLSECTLERQMPPSPHTLPRYRARMALAIHLFATPHQREDCCSSTASLAIALATFKGIFQTAAPRPCRAPPVGCKTRRNAADESAKGAVCPAGIGAAVALGPATRRLGAPEDAPRGPQDAHGPAPGRARAGLPPIGCATRRNARRGPLGRSPAGRHGPLRRLRPPQSAGAALPSPYWSTAWAMR